MPHRSFRDNDGRVWDVWDVQPDAIERRRSGERRRFQRPTADRRRHNEARRAVPNDLRDGWLAFECPAERRRLTPIPANWLLLSESDLRRLADGARRLSRSVRLSR